MNELQMVLVKGLDQIETELRRLKLWDDNNPPPPEAFDSELPFFCDTMTFEEWLQWVFLARFRALLEGNHPLPDACQVAPMAEEYYSQSALDTRGLLAALAAFDDIFIASKGSSA